MPVSGGHVGWRHSITAQHSFSFAYLVNGRSPSTPTHLNGAPTTYPLLRKVKGPYCTDYIYHTLTIYTILLPTARGTGRGKAISQVMLLKTSTSEAIAPARKRGRPRRSQSALVPASSDQGASQELLFFQNLQPNCFNKIKTHTFWSCLKNVLRKCYMNGIFFREGCKKRQKVRMKRLSRLFVN